ncbi:MAG TPA: hypothetical protein VHT68_17015 [Pseudolabrys sp.]|nr:hypothetical protein [Pseudolabrys sp.]
MRLRFSDDWGIIELAEAERRIQEFNALIECQRQMVEESEQRGYDRLQIILREQAA